VAVKSISHSNIPGHVKLVIYNNYHELTDIPIDIIHVMALVKLRIRYNTLK